MPKKNLYLRADAAEAEFTLRIRMQGKKYFCRYLLLMFDHSGRFARLFIIKF